MGRGNGIDGHNLTLQSSIIMEKAGGQDVPGGAEGEKDGRFFRLKAHIAVFNRGNGVFQGKIPGVFRHAAGKFRGTDRHTKARRGAGPCAEGYFPMQKDEKMAFSVSSVLFRPVMSARWAEAASR